MKINIKDDVWRTSLSTYAYVLSGGSWTPWKYLVKTAQEIESAIRRPNGRLIINGPPRHGKSELTSKWLPAWYLDLFPSNRVIMTGYGNSHAYKWGRKVRDELRQNRLAISKPRHDVSSVVEWQTLDGGSMFAAGVHGSITGEGGDLFIIDDPHKSWEEGQSILRCDDVFEWFKNTLYQRAEPGASIILNQTRWSTSDLTSRILEEFGGDEDWRHVCFPAIAEENDILGREVGEALCPQRYPREALDRIKKVMGRAFDSVYQQCPKDIEGNTVKNKTINRYTVLPEKFDEVIQSWDFTFKKEGKSNVAGLVVGRIGADIYFLDQVHEKLSFTECLQSLSRLTKKHPYTIRKVVEDRANGPAIMDVLKKQVVGLYAFDPKKYGSKEARFSAVAPVFDSGNIYVPDKTVALWGEDLVKEWIDFPNYPTRDRVDATSQAILYFQSKIANSNIFNLDFKAIGGVRSRQWEF